MNSLKHNEHECVSVCVVFTVSVCVRVHTSVM